MYQPSIYKCKTCGKDVSETAIVCPHCGDLDAIYNADIRFLWEKYHKKGKIRHIRIGVGSVIIWLLLGLFNTSSGLVMILWMVSVFVFYWLGMLLFEESSEMKEIESQISEINAMRDKLKK